MSAKIDIMSRNRAIGDIPQMRNQAVRMACLALAMIGLVALPTGGAQASTSELDVDGLQPVADGQLSAMRGGFNIGGVDISFGVIMETAINGVTKLMTSFNLDNPSHVSLSFTHAGVDVPVGSTTPDGFVLRQAANGGFVLSKTTADGSLRTLQQMGNMGGGIVASIQNSLNNQMIQQNTTMNVGIQNMSTVMGLTTIGVMLDRMGTSLIR
jgi:hypothetical protein